MGKSVRRLKTDSLVDIIKACKEAGVLKLQYGEIEITFGDAIPRVDSTQVFEAYAPEDDRVNSKSDQTTKPGREVTQEQVEAVKQDYLAQLLIDDPVAYEKLQNSDVSEN